MQVLVFGDVLLPVMALTASGFLLGRLTRVSSTPLLIVTFHVLQPALIFQALYANAVSGRDASLVLGLALLLHVVMAGAALLGSRAAWWDEAKSAAAILSFSFNNTGAYWPTNGLREARCRSG